MPAADIPLAATVTIDGHKAYWCVSKHIALLATAGILLRGKDCQVYYGIKTGFRAALRIGARADCGLRHLKQADGFFGAEVWEIADKAATVEVGGLHFVDADVTAEIPEVEDREEM